MSGKKNKNKNNFMKLKIRELLFVFACGSVAGWILEFVYRGLYLRDVTIDFGLMRGPYLPIYGFGATVLYLLLLVKASVWWRALIFVAAATALEFVTGAFFCLTLKLKLWDYSSFALNYYGIVSVAASFFWFLCFLVMYLAREHVLPFIKSADRLWVRYVLVAGYAVGAVDFFFAIKALI